MEQVLEQLERKEIGELIRSIRKSSGLTLENLADTNISPATISNIERGVPQVLYGKIRYLLSKLDISDHQLPELLANLKESHTKQYDLIMAAESLSDFRNLEEAKEMLRRAEVNNTSDPLYSLKSFVLGKISLEERQWKLAEVNFNEAIHACNNPKSNIISGSLANLGYVAFHQNDLFKALDRTNEGLRTFVEGGEREHIRYFLIQNKAIFLDKLNRVGEAIVTLDEMVEEIHLIQNPIVITHLYHTRASLSLKTKHYEAAKQFALKGAHTAHQNLLPKHASMCFSLLAEIHIKLEELDDAERYIHLARHIQKGSDDQRLSTHTYTQAGILYIQKGMNEKANNYLDLAIENGKKYGDHFRLESAYLAKGDVSKNMGYTNEAISYYKKGLALASTNQNIEQEQQALLRLALI
ncbi:hypothetical protein [Mechercharimyces sp. CAU 1602]|uniref:hypothetical protein n=1 Tax=Mechercharimyces sp. CAU 1602 TaxID=2973933 RepID=UPI002161FC8D|nr:hypothetical protein [Mechercharimyces sp. CAU 1602]MCS1350424.1 hypothetical protein [Mechercharimyces sp. CAU 1602]